MVEIARDGDSARIDIYKRAEIVPYGDYRQLCDSVDQFRKTGIQSESAYQGVLADQDTIFAKWSNDLIVPILAPLQHEKMYDTERCKELTGKGKVFLLSLPVEILGEGVELSQEIDSGAAIIVEEFVSSESDSTTTEKLILGLIGRNFHKTEFVHKDLAGDAEHETAWMAAYTVDFSPEQAQDSDSSMKSNQLAADVYQIWKELHGDSLGVMPDSASTGTFFFTPSQLSESSAIVDSLWSISELGFGKVLGAHHPVSMEFTREFFDQQITSDGTVTAVHYVEGEPVCFGFVSMGMDKNDWIDTASTAISEQIDQAKRDGRVMVHFYELISNGEKGMGHSSNILSTFLSVAAHSGYKYKIFFESTNLSSLYIPVIAEAELAKAGFADRGNVNEIGRLSYWAAIAD